MNSLPLSAQSGQLRMREVECLASALHPSISSPPGLVLHLNGLQLASSFSALDRVNIELLEIAIAKQRLPHSLS